MGVFQRFLGCCFASCFGWSTRPRRRNSYPNHNIPKVFKQSVSNSYQAKRNHSSSSQRYSSGAETPLSSYSSQTAKQPTQSRVATAGRPTQPQVTTARQPTQSRVAKSQYLNYDREPQLSTRSSNSNKLTSIRTQQTSSGSSATNTSAIPVNKRSKSTNTGRGKVSQHASPHHSKQQQKQSYQVKPPKTQPVTLPQAAPARSPRIPVKYDLKNFTSQLKTTPTDATFEPKADTIYQSQWTACSAIIIDQFGNQLSNFAHTVQLSGNSRVEFCDSKTKAGRLHFNMKCSETGNISITIQIDKLKFVKDFYVICGPCSSTLSEMVFKEIDECHKCVYRLAIVDVFNEPISADSPVVCELKIVSPRKNMDVVKFMYSENGRKYFDITVRGERPWSKDLVILLNGNPISPATKFEFSHEEREKVLLARDKVPILSIDNFVNCLGSRTFIPFLTGDDDGQFVPYNENNCQLQLLPGRNGYQLVCENARKYDILGADFAHINNIKRVLELKDRVEINEATDQANVTIDLKNVQSHLHPICKEVVQHLLRGLYYRRKAAEMARVRMEWKKRFASLRGLLSRNSPSLELCKVFRDFFGELMNKYNRAACDELFKFFNFQRDESELDLHGLLVADEEKLELLKLDMLRGSLNDEEIEALFRQCRMKSFKGRQKQALKKELLQGDMPQDEIEEFIELCRNYIHDESRLKAFEIELLERQQRSSHVNGIIMEWRSESDEAIRKLKENLTSFNLGEATAYNTPWLEIIVGAGRHSRIKNKQNIRPKVEKLLEERNLEFAAVNKGSLVVTFQTYSGPEPCFGEYYCDNCDKCWKSSKSYVKKYQKCARCQVNCWPVKQREKEKVENYQRDGAKSVKRPSGRHQSNLCQRCKELGYPCNEDEFHDSNY